MKKLFIIFILLVIFSTNQFSKSIILNSIFITEYFDTYGDITWQNEKVHLQNFAIALLHDPEMIGCVVFRPDKNVSLNKIKKHSGMVKNYLAGPLKLKKGRVFIVNLPSNEEPNTILQPIPKNLTCEDVFRTGD